MIIPSCVLVIFINMITYIKEGISKQSGKQENYVIGLDSCYMFDLEHGTQQDIDRFMDFACIRHS